VETAIVTGASSGIGLAVAETLAKRHMRVFGLARRFDDRPPSAENLEQRPCDITDTKRLLSTVDEILTETGGVDILVNNAGIGLFGPHETLSPEQIDKLVQTNLTAPLILTGALLRSLRDRKGLVINIASTAAIHPHKFGCAYAATKAGLLKFGESLFEEVRKSDVRVTTFLPDMTMTPFYDQADCHPDEDPGCHITPKCVADAVAFVLDQREGTIPTQIVLKPQRVGVVRQKTHCRANPVK
jgi:short-subunit dehydrogenase